jgi:hypothetical protein
MPKSYPDVTRSGAASAEVQEEGRKPTTPDSPILAPQFSPNSNTNFGRALLLFFVQREASPLEGSSHTWVKLSPFEVRNVLLFIGGGDLVEWRTGVANLQATVGSVPYGQCLTVAHMLFHIDF